MNDWINGVVRTPPKSETTASIRALRSAIAVHNLVVAQPLASLDRPAEEGDLRGLAGLAHLGGADQRAGAAQRLPRFAVGPELERSPPLHSVGPVLGREQRLGDLDRGAVRIAEDGGHLLLPVLARPPRAHRAQRQQAAVGEDDPDRPPQRLCGFLAHLAAPYSPRPELTATTICRGPTGRGRPPEPQARLPLAPCQRTRPKS